MKHKELETILEKYNEYRSRVLGLEPQVEIGNIIDLGEFNELTHNENIDCNFTYDMSSNQYTIEYVDNKNDNVYGKINIKQSIDDFKYDLEDFDKFTVREFILTNLEPELEKDKKEFDL